MSAKPKKDSTNELPMYDLKEALDLTRQIHEKGLETAALSDVAKGCEYANPTSTPFYRRLVASRLFKLTKSPKAELTTGALDYLKPDTDDAKQSALTQSIMGIKVYADIVNQHIGRRLNVELIANKLEKDDSLGITKVCAKTCAAVFVSSLKFAGFITDDGTIATPKGSNAPTAQPAEVQTEKFQTPNSLNGADLTPDEDSQLQTLYLDSKRKRKITIKAPLTVTKEELERLRAWLGFQLIVEEQTPESPATD